MKLCNQNRTISFTNTFTISLFPSSTNTLKYFILNTAVCSTLCTFSQTGCSSTSTHISVNTQNIHSLFFLQQKTTKESRITVINTTCYCKRTAKLQCNGKQTIVLSGIVRDEGDALWIRPHHLNHITSNVIPG